MMKTKETSTKEKAIAWWNSLYFVQKWELLILYKNLLNDDTELNVATVTEEEIERIYSKNFSIEEAFNTNIDEVEIEDFSIHPIGKEIKAKIVFGEKSNQKQFKQLDKELHLKHLNKFSTYDKFEATCLNLLQLPLSVDELSLIVKTLKECRDRNDITNG